MKAPLQDVKHVVPRMYPGATVVCIGSGPSLTRDDVDLVRGKAVVIAINDAYRLAPWADVLYACDAKWWNWHKGVTSFHGPKYSIDKQARRWPDVKVLRNTGTKGLELEPSGLRTGRSSGYQAINLAYHLGAKKVLLLGYDMSRDDQSGKFHWFGDHPDKVPSPYRLMLMEYDTLTPELAKVGLVVVNCSRRTALKVFPKSTLEVELQKLKAPDRGVEACDGCEGVAV